MRARNYLSGIHVFFLDSRLETAGMTKGDLDSRQKKSGMTEEG